MTDKQIKYEQSSVIIDGIDVSECEYYDKNKSLLTCTCEEYPCSECHNCYYKQLKRSEAQCEAMFVSHTDLEKKYKAKEQECEELKETFKFVLDETIKEHRLYESKLERIIYEQLQ